MRNRNSCPTSGFSMASGLPAALLIIFLTPCEVPGPPLCLTTIAGARLLTVTNRVTGENFQHFLLRLAHGPTFENPYSARSGDEGPLPSIFAGPTKRRFLSNNSDEERQLAPAPDLGVGGHRAAHNHSYL